MKEISDKELKRLTEDMVISLYSYIKIADSYIQNHIIIPEMIHMGLLIDDMAEQIEKVAPHYCSKLTARNKVNQEKNKVFLIPTA